jgi:RNA polymerase sigma factor (sigma-70 family)
MANQQAGLVLRHLRSVLAQQEAAGQTDRELLRRFAQTRDDEAFAELVRRHGAMVRAVCCRVLPNPADADDVFQAAFLVLARKAAARGWRDSIANWLYTVAYRLALRVRDGQRRRAAQEARAAVPALSDPLAEVSGREICAIVDEELNRLPDALRAALLLCCLEGKTRDEAAHTLGWPLGTLKLRLERGRALLRARLQKRGFTLPAVFTGILMAEGVSRAAVPSALVHAARSAATGTTASPRAARLAHAFLAGNGKVLVHLTAAAVLLTAGLGGLVLATTQATDEPLPQPTQVKSQEPGAKNQESRTDVLGDPLPAGAIARLGSLRLYHGNQVQRVILSPDSKWIVSRAQDGNRLWDARTGKESILRDEFKGARVFATTDNLVAVTRQPGNFHLWDIVTGKELARMPLEVEIATFEPIALSPDGETLACWAPEEVKGTVVFKFQLLDTTNGKSRGRIDLENTHPVYTAAFSADGKTLMTLFLDNALVVWDLTTLTSRLSMTLKINTLGLPALSPDGKLVAANLHGEKCIRLWDVRTQKELDPLPIDTGRRGTSAVTFSPDGKFLAATYEAEAGIWELTNRKQLCRLKGKEAGVSCPVFSRDGKLLAAGDGNAVTMWDLSTGERHHDFGHTYAVDGIAFSPDSKTIVTGAAYTDNIVRAWDLKTGQLKGRWRGHKDGIEAIAYTSDGKLVASGSQDGTVRLWDPATGKEVHRLDGHDGMIYGMAFAPDGKTLAAGGKRKAVHLWDVATGKELRAFHNPGGFILRIVYSPDGQLLATRGIDEDVVRIWDASSGKELRQLRGPKAGCPKLSFAPDSRTLAVNGDDGMVRLWDATTGREIQALGEPLQPGQANRCLGVVFAPDGRSLAAGYDDRTTRIWELVSGRERARFEGHAGVPLGLAYSGDGSLLATGGSDHLAYVWDVQGRHTLPRKQHDLTGADLDRLWGDLANDDARQAYRAFQTLLSSGKQTAALLRERMQRVASVDERRIARLVADLDNDQFETREEATKRLHELGELAEPLLRKALAEKPSPELRRRVENLLAQLDPSRSPTQMRTVRAVELLECLRTTEARQVLERLAEGAAAGRVTREAKAALSRPQR